MSRKVAVVTGSSQGIGFAIVRALCKNFDGDVFLTSRSEDQGREAVKILEGEGLHPKFHLLDITIFDDVERLKTSMVSEYGGIDVLINNAGIAFKAGDTTPFGTQAEITMKTNYFGTLETSKILLPIIKPNGRVVNLSSIISVSSLFQCSPELQKVFRSGAISEEELSLKMNEFVAAAQNHVHEEKGWPNTAYGVSKIGVTVMSRIHARWFREQGKNDILLNACCPGLVRTSLAFPGAPKSPDEGVETPVYLALLPVDYSEPHGQLVSDKKVREW